MFKIFQIQKILNIRLNLVFLNQEEVETAIITLTDIWKQPTSLQMIMIFVLLDIHHHHQQTFAMQIN